MKLKLNIQDHTYYGQTRYKRSCTLQLLQAGTILVYYIKKDRVFIETKPKCVKPSLYTMHKQIFTYDKLYPFYNQIKRVESNKHKLTKCIE